MNLLAFILAYAGLSTLCLGMRQHRHKLCARPLSPAIVRAMQALSWTLLALSLLAARQVYGTAIGVAVWLGLSSLAALAVGLLLTYRPKLLAALAPALLLSALRAIRPASGAADR